MQTINPATGQFLEEYPELGKDELQESVAQSQRAFLQWREVSIRERAERLGRVAGQLQARRDELALLMTDEMGKPIGEARAEIEKCGRVCEFYSEHAQEMLAPRIEKTEAEHSYVRYDPLGVILAIMPWNFPYWQVFRFAAPNLVAGNVGLLKHARNVAGCALAIEGLFREAGFPEGALTALLTDSDSARELIRHDAVRGVTLTGSERAGRSVGAVAGEEVKKSVLELGGSDPFVVLEDADVGHAAALAVKSRTINTGQSCIAAKRFIVAEKVYDKFRDRFLGRMRELRVGDPRDEETDLGPLAREDLLENLHEQVEASVEEGAKLLEGGRRLDREGFYYAPTVLDEVRPGMRAFDEETFGPVAALIRATDEDDAIELANRSTYGLGATICTADLQRGELLAQRLEAGSVFINQMVQSDPRLPFGGVKHSGYGRELSVEALREFMNIKTVSADKLRRA